MKKFEIEWETDFCEETTEKSGVNVIEAENEAEAVKKFNKINSCGVIMSIREEI